MKITCSSQISLTLSILLVLQSFADRDESASPSGAGDEGSDAACSLVQTSLLGATWQAMLTQERAKGPEETTISSADVTWKYPKSHVQPVAEAPTLEIVTGASEVKVHHKKEKHPMWKWEWDEVYDHWGEVIGCCFALIFAGILCSAGGIGGGGIFVTLLMVVGGLEPKQAVPLSKSIVFFGSIASLILNLRRKVTGENNKAVVLIDYSICRIVVPASLLGTMLGVLFNRHMPDWAIVMLLCIILVLMTYASVKTTYTQYKAEQAAQAKKEEAAKAAAAEEARGASSGAQGTSEKEPAKEIKTTEPHVPRSSSAPDLNEDERKAIQLPRSVATPRKSKLTNNDLILSAGLLLTVIACGTLRFHSKKCDQELDHKWTKHDIREACHHPLLYPFFVDQMENVMRHDFGGHFLRNLVLVVPIVMSIAIVLYQARTCVKVEGWQPHETLLFAFVSLSTGALAGLVGIGGGLIFSPFFLWMGIDPSVAVATSSTCVIFTSSSTTLQYLFTDRIIMPLTIIYGIVCLTASWIGTSSVHLLQANFGDRKSYISGIIASGVLVSAVLSAYKLSDPSSSGH
eukprot:gnl/TRDRNA2_/TRDRNA2_186840_c0_seq1.p1 gnl/TRDRNA2_/TRDRNA2_186840_c0~~gnl/TRDRNA2_/TRDRNA2_186840_c0_seq1.p1  ORF type:complete len:572 (-),score=96.53 gnl/TRDRNA2_/TRDRNA2_186840_c0_seq1:56-1771(-)